jgi:hypothetical protein
MSARDSEKALVDESKPIFSIRGVEHSRMAGASIMSIDEPLGIPLWKRQPVLRLWFALKAVT